MPDVRSPPSSLDAHCDAHAAAYAQRGEALFRIPLLHLVEQGHQHAGARRADRIPIAMAPPLTLTLLVSQPRSLFTAQACAAKASLASTRSRSPTFQPAFLSAAREAGIGPVPMILGSTPACAHDTMRASGFLPSLAACLAVIRTTAAGPSLLPDALPAVTVPYFSKAGRSLVIQSAV